MISPLDLPPVTRPNLPFPGGDVNGRYSEKAHVLLGELIDCDNEQQITKLNSLQNGELSIWRFWTGQDKNYQDLRGLHRAWAESTPGSSRGETIAYLGTFTTIAFMQRSRILPVNFNDFTNELEAMSEYDEERITDFANEAWSNMLSAHPRVYGVLDPLVWHIARVNEVTDDDSSLALLDASAALPYLMSSTTQMISSLEGALKNDTPFLIDLPTKEDTVMD